MSPAHHLCLFIPHHLCFLFPINPLLSPSPPSLYLTIPFPFIPHHLLLFIPHHSPFYPIAPSPLSYIPPPLYSMSPTPPLYSPSPLFFIPLNPLLSSSHPPLYPTSPPPLYPTTPFPFIPHYLCPFIPHHPYLLSHLFYFNSSILFNQPQLFPCLPFYAFLLPIALFFFIPYPPSPLFHVTHPSPLFSITTCLFPSPLLFIPHNLPLSPSHPSLYPTSPFPFIPQHLLIPHHSSPFVPTPLFQIILPLYSLTLPFIPCHLTQLFPHYPSLLFHIFLFALFHSSPSHYSMSSFLLYSSSLLLLPLQLQSELSNSPTQFSS